MSAFKTVETGVRVGSFDPSLSVDNLLKLFFF